MNINSGTWYEIELQKRIQQQVEQLEAKNQRLERALKKILLRVKNPAIHYKSDLMNIIFDMERIAQQALEDEDETDT